MNFSELKYDPVEGKTYSLFGERGSTAFYFQDIRNMAEDVLKKKNNIEWILKEIHNYSGWKKYLKSDKKKTIIGDPEMSNHIETVLGNYTEKVEDHLEGLSIIRKMRDKRLGTTREEYHLYMLEIELTNRLYREKFLQSDRKIALLPHCLQDFSVECKSEPSGPDFVCKHCSKQCYQNYVSRILKKHDIEPRIWMGTGIKETAKATIREGKSFGILGIACIPELAWGMRKCRKLKIPVIGLPLNANRCRRWFGEFYPNSVDLAELEKLAG